jgi:hypothetical protein
MKPAYCLALVYEDGSVFIDSTAKSEIELTGLAKPNAKFKVVKVKVEEHIKRSLPASALMHVWCKTLSGHIGEDVISVKQMLKIKFGFPILLAANNDISVKLEWMFKKMGWNGLSWEQKLKLAELIPCTSIMSTKQLKQMMDDIKDWSINKFDVVLDNGKR